MSIVHHIIVRARRARSQQLQRCLAGLEGVRSHLQGCIALQVQATRGDPLSWRVTSVWRRAAERDAFLEGECLRRVLAEALAADLIAHLESAQEPLRRAA
jgi:quinol monooxygenase YgiN